MGKIKLSNEQELSIIADGIQAASDEYKENHGPGFCRRTFYDSFWLH